MNRFDLMVEAARQDGRLSEGAAALWRSLREVSTVSKIEVILEQPQPKKHVVRFDASDDDAAVANVYVTKLGLSKLGDPSRIKLTIEAA